MKFTATLRGVSFDDPKTFAAAVKAAPPLEPFTRGGKPVKVPMAPDPNDVGIKGFPIFVKPCVTLTAAEREWLGATVRRSDGTVGQVWAMHPQPGYVWVVADGDFWFGVHTDSLEKLQDGRTPLPLEDATA